MIGGVKGIVGRLLPWVAIAAVSGLSSIPASKLPDLSSFPGGDKWFHGAVFMALTLLFRGWRGPDRPLREWLPGAVFILVLFAFADEWHQSKVPGRVADFADGASDGVGIALGALLAWIDSRSKKSE